MIGEKGWRQHWWAQQRQRGKTRLGTAHKGAESRGEDGLLKTLRERREPRARARRRWEGRRRWKKGGRILLARARPESQCCPEAARNMNKYRSSSVTSTTPAAARRGACFIARLPQAARPPKAHGCWPMAHGPRRPPAASFLCSPLPGCAGMRRARGSRARSRARPPPLAAGRCRFCAAPPHFSRGIAMRQDVRARSS